MKTLRMILAVALSALSVTAFAQSNVIDEVYMTPSQARKLKAERQARYEAYRQDARIRRAKEAKEAKEYREQVVDWYNRRQTNASSSSDSIIPDFERSGQGYYAQRMKRFGDNHNAIVLKNVDRVYILDDMTYDPESDSYYGYDRGSNVSISINNNYGYGYYGGFHSYWGPYIGFSGFYPWYDWYGPGYYGYYSPWHRHRLYYGGFYDPWYASYSASYWGPYGYYDPWYGGSYYGGYNDGYIDGYGHGSYRARTYSSYGRQGSGYYSRAQRTADDYGRALGRSIESIRSGYNNSRNYDHSSSTSNIIRKVINRDWNGGYDSSRTTSTRSESYNTRTSNSSGGYSTGSSGSSNRSSGGGYRSGNSRRR